MTTFLANILETKRQEVERLRETFAPVDLSGLPPCRGFARAIRTADGLAVIAEVKKASPSKGLIAPEFYPVTTAQTYEQGGAAAISVLTDTMYFQGSLEYLTAVKRATRLPILRKDFMIDELQLEEARAAGADAVLLIVAALERQRLIQLSGYAQSLGMDVLIEVHSLEELPAALAANPSVLGVNNRNLHTFQVDLDTTPTVLQHVPEDLLVIAESGVHTPEDAERMRVAGARGILVGESLMRLPDANAVRESIQRLRRVPAAALERGEAK